jgi:hypothetical protein
MPTNERENDLDQAFRQFGKQLRAKVKAKDPTKNADLQARLESIDDQTPSNSILFEQAEPRLHQLKEEFHFEVQIPQTPQDHVVHLLAASQAASTIEGPLAAADVYAQIHGSEQHRGLSMKAFHKFLKKLEKDGVIQLAEVKGTLVLQLCSEFLTEDESTILGIAARKEGKASLEAIMLSTQWPQARVRLALEALIAKDLMVIKKSFVSGTRYQVTEKL